MDENDAVPYVRVLLVPSSGRDAALARFERYDRLVHHSDPVPPKAIETGGVLSLRYWGGWCTGKLGDVALLDRVSIDPIPSRHRIGVSTSGSGTRIRALELFKGR